MSALPFDINNLAATVDEPTSSCNDMKGSSESGSIGLWVDLGTEGYFKDLSILGARECRNRALALGRVPR
jgi:hypothetical protein